MSLLRAAVYAVGFLVCLVLTGCLPGGGSQMDEQKEPHFLTGKSRATSMDYKGAIESFEKALEVNPHSSSAHFELGLLYEKNEMDFAAAIHHFNQYLKLRPSSEYADVVKQRIANCKVELAKTVSLGPGTIQREYDRLVAENVELKRKIVLYETKIQSLTNTPPVSRPVPAVAPSASVANVSAAPRSVSIQASALTTTGTSEPSISVRTQTTASTTGKTYTVQSGESYYTIAKKHRVSLQSLIDANPGTNPTKLKAGQKIRVP